MTKELTDRLYEQNETVRKMTLEKLESEYRTVLEKLVESKDNYNDLYGYYFSLVVELYSRYVLENPNENFTSAEEYRNSLQKRIEKSTST
jgi:hypothetical protein|tara:strand:+ start:227 stop:496 length:270 start_codon:yes stop_codon:yes gene_type:complete